MNRVSSIASGHTRVMLSAIPSTRSSTMTRHHAVCLPTPQFTSLSIRFGRHIGGCRSRIGMETVAMAFRGGNRGGRRPSNRGRGPPNKRGGDRRDVLMNEEISASEVRVIGEDKEALGVMGIGEALELAEDAGVDLLLVVPDASPPVCRLCEYSKYKYEKTKAEKDAKKKQRESVIEVKELKMRPGTDVHDYQVRVRAAQKFIDKNFRVKLTLQFRGREMEFKEIGREMFERFVEDLGGEAVVNIESPMRMQGRQMNMVISKKEGATVAVNSGGPGEARGGDDLVDEEVAGEEVAASEESEETVV